MMISFKIFHSKSLLFIAFIISFLYLVEISLGVRTVIYAFQRFRNVVPTPTSEAISWAAAVVPLLLSMATFMAISCLSLYWSLETITSAYKSIYHCCHIVTGGILWRYVGLFRCESVDQVEDQAMLLASLKFLFTQIYTIPLLITHIFLHDNPYELLYDVILLSCITMTQVLTTSVFNRYEKSSDYRHETMQLVPLLFHKPDVTSDQSSKPKKICFLDARIIWAVVITIQSTCFTLGRLLALGILLKLAGVYAITIILLQFLVSVLYLKFHAASLVPEMLKKSKQLIRLFFLSYVLVFEWQLHRNTTTGYTLETRTKHGMLYYTIATVESMFYFTVWAITECQPVVKKFSEDSHNRYEYVVIVSIIGCMCLVISYAIHLSIVLFKVIPSARGAIRKRFRRSIGHLCRKDIDDDDKPPPSARVVPKIDITPISDQIEEKKSNDSPNVSPEAKYGSYRDLKENLNYDSSQSPASKKSKKLIGYPKQLFQTNVASERSKSVSPTESPKTDSDTQQKEAKSTESLMLKISRYTREYVKTVKRSKDDQTDKKVDDQPDKNADEDPQRQQQHRDSPGPSRKIRNVVKSISPKIERLKNINIKRILPKVPTSSKKEEPAEISCETLKIPSIMNEYGNHEFKPEKTDDSNPDDIQHVEDEGESVVVAGEREYSNLDLRNEPC